MSAMSSPSHDRPRVCIVGAGIVGLSTAYYLATSGRCGPITLVEEGDVAGGASGKAAGFLARDWHGPPTSSLGKLSFKLHQELAASLNGKQRYGYRQMPSLSMHIIEGQGRPSARKTIEQHNRSLGWMNADNIVDIDFMEDESATAQVHPKLFCETLLSECESLGVRIVNCRAENAEYDRQKPRVKFVRCSNGEQIALDKLVITAGPWTGQVAKSLVGATVPVKELAGHSLVITTKEPLPALAGFASAQDENGEATTSPEWFTRPDGTIYVAGENSGAPLPPGTKDVQTSETSLARLAAVCRLISPRLDISDPKAVTHVSKQLCYRPVSRRGYPYICSLPVGSSGKDADSNVFVGAGHGPWGISLGPGSGLVLSELVLDGRATSANIDYLGL